MPDLPAAAPLKLFALAPIWGAPNPSPFVIKLMTWLRMAGIPYEHCILTSPPSSPTGKIPYVKLPDGTALHDSELIIAELARRHHVNLDAHLTTGERAVGHLVRRTFEEHLYFAGLYDRWITEEGYAASSRDYFAAMPLVARWILPRTLRPRMRKYLHGQGLGRHPAEVIAAKAREDLAAIAEVIGEREYMLGELSSVDATAYGFLTSSVSNPFPSAMRDALFGQPRLVAYQARMRARFWP
jgi:glutathione S-transferase